MMASGTDADPLNKVSEFLLTNLPQLAVGEIVILTRSHPSIHPCITVSSARSLRELQLIKALDYVPFIGSLGDRPHFAINPIPAFDQWPRLSSGSPAGNAGQALHMDTPGRYNGDSKATLTRDWIAGYACL